MNFRYLKYTKILGLFCIGCSIISCRDNTPVKDILPPESIVEQSIHPYFVTNLEYAHEKEAFMKNEAVCFNLELTFGSNKSLMKIFTTTNSSAIRVDKIDGTSTIMIDKKVYTNADSDKYDNEKFGIYTYQYFFMIPYKLSDHGTQWQQLPAMEMNGKMLDRAKLTFDQGTGDAPDDWYIVHSDPESRLIQYVGYIVTGGGTTVEEAEKNAHAIQYEDFMQTDGVPIPRTWKFYTYDKDDGIGKQIGNAVLRNVEFMDVTDQFVALEEDGYTKIN